MSDGLLREGILAYYDSFSGLVKVRVLTITPEGVVVRVTNDDVRAYPKGDELTVHASTLAQHAGVRVDRNGHIKVRNFNGVA